jgi:hypothetical protein
MPDIAMCMQGDCPRSKTCYRHEDSGTKPNDHRQSYFLGGDPANCEWYWPTRKELTDDLVKRKILKGQDDE